MPRARAGGQYRSLLAIVRLSDEPLGRAVIEVELDGSVSRDRLDFELRRQVGEVPGTLSFEPRSDIEGSNSAQLRRTPVSVVVTTCCNPGRLARCLRSILSCSYADFEVIVVENRPGSGATRRLLAERFANDSRLRYIEEPDRGLSCARNAGLAVADGDLVAFTDDDVIVDEAWIRRSAQAFEHGEGIACVTGLILPLELETDSQLLLEQFMTLGKGFSREVFRLPDALERHPLLPYTPGVVGSGANTVLRADAARQLGGFDPTLGTGTLAAGGEDLDLYIRLLREGHAVAYEPGAIVWHAHPSGMSKLRGQVYRYGVGLGAALAKQLLAGPERWQLMRAVPAGIGYLLDPAASKNAGKTTGYPRRLEWLERLGMLVGPAGYLASALLRRYRGLSPERA
ncbi:MAG: glycosyltransferase [Actinomycetota bacterium]|nr:glycosyltransferase [Actinomycetota bacterium]